MVERQTLEVHGTGSRLKDALLSWCKATGNVLRAEANSSDELAFLIEKAAPGSGIETAEWGIRLPHRDDGHIDVRDWLIGRAGRVPDEAPAHLGFAPRGSAVERRTLDNPSTVNAKADVWADNIGDLYELAKNPAADILWRGIPPLPENMERAVGEVMTFLAENEYSALYVPAKFLPRINPQFVEAILFLATVIQDEAKHVEVFTKRTLVNGGGLQRAASLTDWSHHSFVVEEDYFKSSFLLHVMREGTVLDLLKYVVVNSPEPISQDIAHRTRPDEGRHVGYGITHARCHLQRYPHQGQGPGGGGRGTLRVLEKHTSGENRALLEALAVLGGHDPPPSKVTACLAQVESLKTEMHESRVRRMVQIGLPQYLAERLSRGHTSQTSCRAAP